MAWTEFDYSHFAKLRAEAEVELTAAISMAQGFLAGYKNHPPSKRQGEMAQLMGEIAYAFALKLTELVDTQRKCFKLIEALSIQLSEPGHEDL